MATPRLHLMPKEMQNPRPDRMAMMYRLGMPKQVQSTTGSSFSSTSSGRPSADSSMVSPLGCRFSISLGRKKNLAFRLLIGNAASLLFSFPFPHTKCETDWQCRILFKNAQIEVKVRSERRKRGFPESIWNISSSGEPVTLLKLICSLCITHRIKKAGFKFQESNITYKHVYLWCVTKVGNS